MPPASRLSCLAFPSTTCPPVGLRLDLEAGRRCCVIFSLKSPELCADDTESPTSSPLISRLLSLSSADFRCFLPHQPFCSPSCCTGLRSSSNLQVLEVCTYTFSQPHLFVVCTCRSVLTLNLSEVDCFPLGSLKPHSPRSDPASRFLDQMQ